MRVAKGAGPMQDKRCRRGIKIKRNIQNPRDDCGPEGQGQGRDRPLYGWSWGGITSRHCDRKQTRALVTRTGWVPPIKRPQSEAKHSPLHRVIRKSGVTPPRQDEDSSCALATVTYLLRLATINCYYIQFHSVLLTDCIAWV